MGTFPRNPKNLKKLADVESGTRGKCSMFTVQLLFVIGGCASRVLS